MPQAVDQAAVDAAGAIGAATSMLRPGSDAGQRPSRISRVGTYIAAGHLAYTTGRQLVQVVRNKLNEQRYSVALLDSDVLYGPVQEWVLAHMPAEEQRAVIVRTDRRVQPVELVQVDGSAELDTPPARLLHVHFDGDRAQEVVIGGHTILVGISREATDDGGQDYGSRYRPSKITFGSKTLESRDAVLAFLGEVRQGMQSQGRRAQLYTATRWGDWATTPLHVRPPESVILRPGQMDMLLADLERFYALRERYLELGQPWHRGYLFHGPPGTGKTSTARALASKLDLDVHYLPLADLKLDADLTRMLAGIGPRSMLLLEDIDVAHAATERDDTNEGISASGLLNALDGIITPEGLVMVMTTNNRGALDEAMLRRANVEVEMGYLDAVQLNQLARQLLGDSWLATSIGGNVADHMITPNQVVEIIKRHLDDNDTAAKHLVGWLHGLELGLAPEDMPT